MPNTRQTIAPDPFTKQFSEGKSRNLVIELSRIEVVFRYLTSKIVTTDEHITTEEIIVLFHSMERIVQKSTRDGVYRQKWMSEVFTFRAIYQSLETLLRMDPKERLALMRDTYGFYRGKMVSLRYYRSVQGQNKKLFRAQVENRFPKTIPPKGYIGKGYGDHGTAKNMANDGSPSWQEVAAVGVDETVLTSKNDEQAVFRSLQVHRNQLLRSRDPRKA